MHQPMIWEVFKIMNASCGDHQMNSQRSVCSDSSPRAGLGRIRLKMALSDSARSNVLEEIKINPCRFRLPHIKDFIESQQP